MTDTSEKIKKGRKAGIPQKKKEKEFLPVIQKGKKEKYPTSSLVKCQMVEPEKVDAQYLDYVAVYTRDATNKEDHIYIKPSIFEKYVLKKEYIFEDANRIKEQVLRSLENLKNAWLHFGTSIIPVHTARLYRVQSNNFDKQITPLSF